MFEYTKASFSRLTNGFKILAKLIKYGAFAITLAYFGVAIALGIGNLWANIALVTITVASFVFDIATDKKKEETKRARKVVKRLSSWGKLAVKAVTLGISVYGIYLASDATNGISIILATLMIIMWVLQVLFQVIASIVEDEMNIIMASIKKDFEPITQIPKKMSDFFEGIPHKVSGLWDKLQGKEPEPEPKKEPEPESPEIVKLKKFMEKERKKKEKNKKTMG